MKRRLSLSVLVLAPVVLAACASTPEYRYYTLDMRQRAAVDVPAQVDEVRLRAGEALARPEILVRTSPTRIEYYALDRWASGLEEQLERKLTTEFGQRPHGPYAATLTGTIMSFEQVDTPQGADAHVTLDMELRLSNRESSETSSFTRRYDVVLSADAAEPDAVVQALSRAVEQVAREMAKDMAMLIEDIVQGEPGGSPGGN